MSFQPDYFARPGWQEEAPKPKMPLEQVRSVIASASLTNTQREAAMDKRLRCDELVRGHVDYEDTERNAYLIHYELNVRGIDRPTSQDLETVYQSLKDAKLLDLKPAKRQR